MPLGVARVLGELARRAGLHDRAAHPAREADAHAVDVGAGVVQQSNRLGVAPELEADLLEDRVGVLLDERQALLAEDLERRELAGQERDVLGVGARRIAWRAARPPLRRRWVSSISRPPSPDRHGPATPPLVAGVRPGPARAGASLGQLDDLGQVREGGRLVREGHRLDEMLLEARLDRGLDLLDPPDDALDLGPGLPRQERDQRAGPGRVAGRLDVGQVAVGHEPEDHRVDRVDLAAEGAGQADLVELVDLELVHQQPDAGIQRGLGSWMARTSFWVIAIRGPAAVARSARRGGRS